MSAVTQLDETDLGRRRQDRSEYPIVVGLAGRQFEVQDWSEYGFRIPVKLTEMPFNETFPVQVTIPQEGGDVTFKARVRPVWTAGKPSGSGFEFVGLDEQNARFLSHLRDNSFTQKEPSMVGYFEGLSVPERNSVDVPVVELPDPKPKSEEINNPPPENKESLPKRSWLITLLYFGLGLLLTWFIASSVLNYFLRVNVDSAILSRPVERIVSPVNGVVKAVLAKEGESVALGQVLMQIDSLDSNREISAAEAELDNAKFKLAKAEAELNASRRSIGVYQALANENFTAAQNKVSNSAESLRLAASELANARRLFAQNVISSLEYDAAATRHNRAKSAYDEATAELGKFRLIKEQAAAGSYYSKQRKEIDINELEANAEVAASRVELAQKKLQRARENAIFSLKAPYDAHVVTLHKSPGNAVVSAENIMVLEKDSQPVIEAFVSHNELSKIRVNSSAKVYVPTLDKSFSAKVVAIDPTARFTHEDTFRLSWQESTGNTDTLKSSRVTLEIPKEVHLSSELGSLAGLPVEVSFKRAGSLL